MDDIDAILQAINELQEDTTVPKNIKTKLQSVAEILKGTSDKSIKINKALNELDEISDDVNIQPYTRTQLWNIVSMLESA